MMLCEETASVLEMVKPKVVLIEAACEGRSHYAGPLPPINYRPPPPQTFSDITTGLFGGYDCSTGKYNKFPRKQS